MTKKKITFCKETKLTKDGLETFYFTREDDSMVSGSVSITEQTARDFFETYVKLGGNITREEVIEEVTI